MGNVTVIFHHGHRDISEPDMVARHIVQES